MAKSVTEVLTLTHEQGYTVQRAERHAYSERNCCTQAQHLKEKYAWHVVSLCMVYLP